MGIEFINWYYKWDFFLILEIFSTVEKFSLNIYKKRGYNKLQSKWMEFYFLGS